MENGGAGKWDEGWENINRTGRGVNGEGRGRGEIQQTPGPGVGSLCDQLKIQTKQLYVINTAQTAMWA